MFPFILSFANFGKHGSKVSTTEVNRDITLQVLSVQPANSCVRMVAPGM